MGESFSLTEKEREMGKRKESHCPWKLRVVLFVDTLSHIPQKLPKFVAACSSFSLNNFFI